ncbi:MAG: ROK family protein [Clostridia bacterium]|nr:ROK family protein [Clostridia bacterium]
MLSGFETINSIEEEAKNIFGIVLKNGPQTKNNLSLLTKTKLSTLNRVMQPLEKMGLLMQSRIGESTGGRKPVLYDVNGSKYYIAGIDISRTYTQIVITNLKMEVAYKQHFIMEADFSPVKTVSYISRIVRSGMQSLGIDYKMLLGIGVGAVGPLDRQRGVIINPINFESPGWRNTPLKLMLESELKVPVIIDNGANAAVLGEFLYGKGKGFKSIAYINCGIGIRTGAISSATIVRTINDTEDAFGHMVIDVDGEACSCGKFGCIECYSSIVSITRKFTSELKKGRSANISKLIKDISYTDICSAAENGDELAKEVITGAGVILGTGLANYINLLNPGLVVLSGPLTKHSSLFYKTCTDVALNKCYSGKEGRIVFSRGGHFEENEISVGAAALVMESYLNEKMLG